MVFLLVFVLDVRSFCEHGEENEEDDPKTRVSGQALNQAETTVMVRGRSCRKANSAAVVQFGLTAGSDVQITRSWGRIAFPLLGLPERVSTTSVPLSDSAWPSAKTRFPLLP